MFRNLRPFLWPIILCVLVVVLIGLPMLNGQMGKEVYFAFLVGGLYLIYHLLEFQALKSTQEEELDDPLIGKKAEVSEDFAEIGGGFEGRILVNGAPWTGRSTKRRLVVGENATVVSIDGQILLLDSEEKLK